MDIPDAQNYVKTLTRLSENYPKRRRLRTLIVQGAAAAQTDNETKERLREEQLSHLEVWIAGYEQHRDAMGIDAAVDLRTAVIYTWAVEVGLGVLESMGIEPQSPKAWADMANRFRGASSSPPTRGPAGSRARSDEPEAKCPAAFSRLSPACESGRGGTDPSSVPGLAAP